MVLAMVMIMVMVMVMVIVIVIVMVMMMTCTLLIRLPMRDRFVKVRKVGFYVVSVFGCRCCAHGGKYRWCKGKGMGKEKVRFDVFSEMDSHCAAHVW